jgi:hypothetical protein
MGIDRRGHPTKNHYGHGSWRIIRPSVGEVTIVNPAYLRGGSGSYVVQHAVLGQLGKYPED